MLLPLAPLYDSSPKSIVYINKRGTQINKQRKKQKIGVYD